MPLIILAVCLFYAFAGWLTLKLCKGDSIGQRIIQQTDTHFVFFLWFVVMIIYTIERIIDNTNRGSHA